MEVFLQQEIICPGWSDAGQPGLLSFPSAVACGIWHDIQGGFHKMY